MAENPTYAKFRDGLTGETASGVQRSDGALIPADPANTDWQAYQDWLAAGNAPSEPDLRDDPKQATAA